MSLVGQFFILADETAEKSYAALIACAKVIVLVAIGAAGVWMLRRWLKRDDAGPTPAGFSLSDLRQLRDSGQMTPEEYERAREKIVAAAKKGPATQKTDSAKPFPPRGI